MLNSMVLVAVISVVLITTHLLMDSFYKIGIPYFLYLLFTGQIKHFIAKKRLVPGDLVFIRYRGKLRKACITTTSYTDNRIQLKFFDKELNIDLVAGNWYSLSRLVLPEFMKGKAGKVLYSDLED